MCQQGEPFISYSITQFCLETTYFANLFGLHSLLAPDSHSENDTAFYSRLLRIHIQAAIIPALQGIRLHVCQLHHESLGNPVADSL